MHILPFAKKTCAVCNLESENMLQIPIMHILPFAKRPVQFKLYNRRNLIKHVAICKKGHDAILQTWNKERDNKVHLLSRRL